MFRRKEEENLFNNAEGEASEAAASPAAPAAAAPQQASFAAPAAPSAPAAPRPVAEAPRAPSAPAAGAFRASAPSAPGRASQPAAPAADKSNKANKRILTVGADINLKGEIASCDLLMIEGFADATLKDVKTLEITQTGSFKGSAEVEDAEISGTFEGDLVVRNRLMIFASGKVNGKISYGEIEVERGGQLTGEIRTASQPATASSKKAA